MQLTRRAPPYAQIAIVIAVFAGPMTAAAPQPTAPRLDFEVQEGLNLNRFVREGKVAAHLLLRSGTDPRIVIAFPAGNSGVGLWFVHHADRVSFRLRGPPVVDRKSTRLNSSHSQISYAVFCLIKKTTSIVTQSLTVY